MLGLKKKKEEVKKEEKKELVVPKAPEKTKIPASINTEKEETIFKIERTAPMVLPEIVDKTNFDIRYPLIKPYATAHIFWDDKNSELVYLVEEPILDEKEKKILITLEEGIRELINISFISIKEEGVVIEYLEKNMKVLLDELSVTISKASFLKLMYYIYRDFVGLNEIEPIMSDYFIEDVQCNGLNSPVYVVHRKYRNIRTNVVYTDNMKLSSFVEKIAQKCGKYVSYASPLLDGALPDGSVEYNERFIYKENGKIKISKIGKFVDGYYKDFESNTPKSIRNIEVPAFDKDLKIKWKKVDYVYRHKIDGKLYELRLEAGRRVKLSGAHSIFILRKEGIKIERVCNLKEGDYAVVPQVLPENDDVVKEINLAEGLSKSEFYKKIVIEGIPLDLFKEKEKEIRSYYKKNYKRENQAYYEHRNKGILPIRLYDIIPENILRKCKLKTTSPVKIPTFLKVDRELMKLLGYYIAEGWLTKTGNHHRLYFCLSKDERAYIKEINGCLKTCFSNEVYLEPIFNSARKLCLNSLLVYAVFKDVLNVSNGATEKGIPEIIFNVNKDLQKEFIKSWHNGDLGSTASEKLANDISYLGLFNKNMVPFYDRVRGSIIDGRKTESHEFYSNFYRRGVSDFHSMIPMELFNPLNKAHRRLKNKKIGRNRLKRILSDIRFKRFEDLCNVTNKKFLLEWSKRGFIGFIEGKPLLTKEGQELVYELDFLRSLIYSELGFLRINKIEAVDSSNEFVYDVSVPDCENFIAGFGGVCCHNSRVNATYTQDISSKGPTFTIRKFTKEPWTPTRLIDFKTASPELLAYLWILIEYESNVMVIGGTGSGKTTFLNALAFFIPPQARIVSIEDTRELNILHENWLPSVSRAGSSGIEGTETGHGEVTLFDLLRESFRQRPDYVIVGEVRGKEAYVLFQGAASGHPSFSTMHAEDVYTMVRRLETPPINLSPSLVESLDVVCVMTQTKLHDQLVRRLREINEIVKIGERDITNEINTPFTWDPHTDRFFFKMDSRVFDKIVLRHGITREGLNKEFRIRTMLLMKLYQNKIFGFKEVQDIINAYYKTPDKVLKKFNIIV